MKSFHLTVARVGENVFDGDAISVVLPGADGVFTVLADHEPMVSTLKEGEAHIIAADEKTYHVPVTNGGIAEVSKNQATVIL